jgi:hypothetical protein
MTDLRGDGAHHLSLSKAVPLLFTELPRALYFGNSRGTEGTKERLRQSELFQLPLCFFLTPFAFRYALRARSSYPSRAAR